MLKVKYFFLVLLFYSIGCENLPDEVIENKSVEYKLTKFEAPAIVDQKNTSTFQFLAIFENTEDIKSLTFNIKDDFGDKIISGQLTKNSNVFSGKYVVASDTIKGDFVLNLIVYDTFGGSSTIIKHNFKILAKAPNLIPILTNLIAPDSIVVQEPKSLIKISIVASDGNGLSDINKVYFKITKPDGSSSGNKITMFDDGNKQIHNDELASDGIYSTIIEVVPSNDKGKYKFEFIAEDKSGSLSNSIIHYIEIL